jgi:drug/metabolite transporter (DMT)-like permease
MSALYTKEQVSDLKAIGFALAGFTFWVLTDTAVKIVGQSGLPPYEMVAFLGLFMAAFLALYAFARGQQQILRPHRLGPQLSRACIDMVNNVCVVIALRRLSLTIFYILIFTAPTVISMLSVIFLREGLPWKKAVAIAAGFGGVIVAYTHGAVLARVTGSASPPAWFALPASPPTWSGPAFSPRPNLPRASRFSLASSPQPQASPSWPSFTLRRSRSC